MGRKPKILCIDDQVTNLRVRTMLLEQFGCEVVAVEDYQSALLAVTETDIDLLVIDYHLADGQNGEQIARDVRALRPRIPLIMLTGDPKLPDSVRESVDEVLIKGVSNPGELLDRIAELLPGSELRPRRSMLVAQAPKAS